MVATALISSMDAAISIILPFNISLLVDILSLLGGYCTVEGGSMMASEMLPFKEEVKVVEDLLLLLSMNADNCF